MKKNLLAVITVLLLGIATNVNAQSMVNGQSMINGLAQAEDGNWHYYENGVINHGYTGLAQNENGWWLVENGTVNFDYTGLYYDTNYGWWLIGGGSVAFSYDGLWNDPNYGWWLVDNGTPAFGYTGIYDDVNCGRWLIGGGSVAFGYTGLWNDANCGWWLVDDGNVAFDYTGVYNDVNCGSWYVSGGTIDWGFSGTVSQDGVNYNVTNGFAEVAGNNAGTNAGASNETADASKNGLMEENGTWCYFKNGVIDTTYTGLAENEYGLWYVENGMVNLDYNGFHITADTDYLVKNSYAMPIVSGEDWNGLHKIAEGTWGYFVDGRIDMDYKGLVRCEEHPARYTGRGEELDSEEFDILNKEHIQLGANTKIFWFYVENGELNYDFTGATLTPNGKVWVYVTNGRFDFDFHKMFEEGNYWWYFEDGILTHYGEGKLAEDDVVVLTGWYYWKDEDRKIDLNRSHMKEFKEESGLFK